MAKQGYVNGSDLLMTIGEKACGHCTSHTTTYTSETKDRAVKPLASKTAPYMCGSFIVASIEDAAPAGDDATYNATFDNTGSVTIDDTKVDGTVEE